MPGRHNDKHRYEKCGVCGGYDCPRPFCATISESEDDAESDRLDRLDYDNQRSSALEEDE